MADINNLITDNIDVWTSAIKKRNAVGRGSSKKIELTGIKKLRALILELAVRGKLVPQHADDEPASVLLKRIAEEKAQLIAEQTIKKQKVLPEITGEEKPYDLPSGWEWTRLGVVTNYGSCDKAAPQSVEADTWVLELEDVEKSTSKLLKKVRYNEREFRSSKNKFLKGDVIYGKLRPYLDKVIVANESGVCTTEMIPVRAYNSLTPEFLRLIMKAPYFIKYANESTHGMNLPRMGTDKARLALIPVLSTNEQHRIVAKVDDLMALCDQLEQQTEESLSAHQTLVEVLLATLTESKSAVTSQENFQTSWQRFAEHFDVLFTTENSIEQLKQTILQLAVMGKLVPQNPSDEPASVLLEKISEEKAQLIADKKIKKHPKVDPIGPNVRLPNSWESIVVQDFADIKLGSTPSRTEMNYWNGDIPWVSSGEVAKNLILDTKEKITQAGFDNSSAPLIPARSLLMAIIGQGKTRGQTALLGIDACTNQNVAAFVFNENHVVPEFIQMWAQSKYDDHRGDGRGGAQPALNGKMVRSFKFPLPPIAEQQRIVAKVDELMALCEQLKARLSDAQTTKLHLADAVVENALSAHTTDT